MNKDAVIRMAREAASEDGTTRPDKNIVLYAAKTNKFLERFAAIVAAHEREECAKECEEVAKPYQAAGASVALECVAAIRARGQE